MQLRELIELPTLHYNSLTIFDEKVIIQAQIPKYYIELTLNIAIRRTKLFDKYLPVIDRELSKGTCLSKIHLLIVQEGYKGARSNFYLSFSDKNLSDSNPFRKTMSPKRD